MLCPICDRDNPVDARRCKACGADFEDPELAAQLERPHGLDADEEVNLTGDRFLTIRWIGLVYGGDLRRVLLLGGILWLVAGLLPVNLDYHGVKAVWSVLGSGPTVALLAPLVLGVIGVALATPLGRGVPPVALAGVLAAGGAAVLAFGVAPLGASCAMPERVPYLWWLGLAVTAGGIAIRVLRPRDLNARWFAVGGAVLVVVGMALPITDARAALPGEFAFFLRGGSLIDKSLAGAALDGFDDDIMVKFLSLWYLLSIPFALAGAALCLPAQKGAWDSLGLALRPIGWALVLYVPLTVLFCTVNIMGWKGGSLVAYQGHDHAWDDFVGALFAGRARLVLVTAPAAAWLVTGLVGLRVHLLPDPLAATAAPPPR